ncbi:central glycolytic genes regulator [Hathewaya proteolytica DSM 3090]|uniref:Central glycolytic genes regulator n=1 Tax=Hathewaya proteolytica DSM 3090 TaxID=1121331 RepID=A0A1M6NT46_9CLOT|nr:sugar-binding domain-containing protein [Hathewaya proteolytica]SHJ98923.1 central glycolytic genes regulator [Hathewaya proteolytica DSM 3090]
MEIIRLEQEIVPELKEILQRRFMILQKIKYNGPIGRRMLSTSLNIGERIIRNEVEILKELKLISVKSEGVSITDRGQNVLLYLQNYIHESKGLGKLEESIKQSLGIKEVHIVPSDAVDERFTVKEVGRFASAFLSEIVIEHATIAIAGGSTMRQVVSSCKNSKSFSHVMVVPARGGVGRNVESQANTLAAQLAEKFNGNYKLLHVPDNLSQAALKALMEDENISEIVKIIKNADILLYGIGEAENMAYKRGASQQVIKEIMAKGAVGEALGNYYDINGNVVYHHTTMGINHDDCCKIRYAIAVACGVNKSKAIVGAIRNKKNNILITDENTACEIFKLLS